MTASTKALELLLIGEGNILVRCSEVLTAKGHKIRGVVSTDPIVRAWATKAGVLCCSLNEVFEHPEQLQVDILFSIGNYTVIPDELLKLAKRMSINYHYGPLPDYSGLHVPSWAIFEQAAEYGITWHRIEKLVDGGNILKQAPVPIEPNDTALSLGLKCDELAVQSLSVLTDELAECRETEIPQDLSKRRYFSMKSQFPAEGLIDWNQNAEQIAALVRATDYGPFSSPLVWPKLMINGQFFAVRGVSVGETATGSAVPGEIVVCDDASGDLYVTTGAGSIQIRSVCSLEGDVLAVSEWVAENKLRCGMCFQSADAEVNAQITVAGNETSKTAAYWRKRLLKFDPSRLPHTSHLSAGEARALSSNNPITKQCQVIPEGTDYEISLLEYLVGGCCTFLARASRVADIHIAIATPRDQITPDYQDLFLPWVPFLTSIDPSATVAQSLEAVCHELRHLRTQGSIRRDFIGRDLDIGERFRTGELAPDIMISWGKKRSVFASSHAEPALELVIGTDSGTIDFHYNSRKMLPEEVSQLASQLFDWWHTLPSAMPQTLDAVSAISAQEREVLIETFNHTHNDSMLGGCFHHLFERSAQVHKSAIALLCAGETLSYEQLNVEANQLAHFLKQKGVGKGDFIGVCLDRSIDLVVTLLAVLKTGAAYVPIDPTFPIDRIRQMVEDAEPTWLITPAELPQTLGAWSDRALSIETFRSESPSYAIDNLEASSNADDLAYLIYTSGSTGKPKGVEITHGALHNFLTSMQQQPGCTETDRLLAVTTISFDIAALELFLPLLCGASVILAQAHETMDGSALIKLIQQHNVTMMQATPTTWQLLLQSGWQGQPALGKILCGGEALSRQLADQLLSCGETVWNMYGPTETTVWSSVWQVHEGDDVVIGSPIANTQLYVLDANLSPVPLGFSGELCIGGAGVARGYHQNLEQTQAVFCKNPFHSGWLYRTGDLARFIEPGKLVVLGRNDGQIKLRGFRIELGDVEAVIADHAEVADTVVVGRNDQLVAYCLRNLTPEIKTSQSQDIENTALADWCSTWDNAYGTEADDATFNLAGWRNSYDGESFSKAEMRDWQRSSIERILSYSPERIFEIGSGSGLMLFGLAPQCREYRAVDASQQAVDIIQRQLHALPNVSCEQRPAHDLPEIEAGHFDTVVLNSVAQYFPNIDYLISVLEWAAETVDNGQIFIGDVRNLSLLNTFYADIVDYQSEDGLSADELKRRAERAQQSENELVIAPEFFSNLPAILPKISRVDIVLRNGSYINEMTRYRYDVTLHIGKGALSLPPEISHHDWAQNSFDLSSLRRHLEIETQPQIQLSNVPNNRLSSAYQRIGQTLGNGPKEALGQWVDPQDLQQIAGEAGYNVTLLPSRSGNDWTFDTIFWQAGERIDLTWKPAQPVDRDALAQFANIPTAGAAAKLPLSRLLSTWLEARLPAYMIPAFFVELDAFPLTPNGKIDRKALPDPIATTTVPAVQPNNELEQNILAIWSDVLGHDRISVYDSFFKIGGNSLRVVRVQADLEKLLGHPVATATLYEFFTIKALAAHLSGSQEAPRPSALKPYSNQNNEDIAIVSMACRLPGNVDNPDDFWALLERGGDGIIEVPQDRWDASALYDPDPDARGKAYCRQGGFVHPIDLFDASFFGISPREARALDPAQRLMLEVSWEAIEQAGYSMDQLRGSQTGVFVGIGKGYHEYGLALAGGLADLDGYFGTGSAGCTMSGRVSYVLGLEGPSVTVDTACSSSLVATHQACTALRQGECDLALAAGVTLLLSPDLHVEFSRLRGMSPDGRCKSFSSTADGTGWSEGAAIVLLRRLSDARRDRDPILAVLRGTAVNHAGHSASLTTPSGPAQQRVIRQALVNSALVPSDIDYLEAHGTGTRLGDPIEATALANVFSGSHSANKPLWVGSVKSNLGHTQAAAGLAGVIKTVLAMQHNKLPRTLHVEEPSPSLNWQSAQMALLQEAQPWHSNGHLRRAGVSSFGIGGTNAHVIVEEAPEPRPVEVAVNESTPLPPLLPFLISGTTEAALRAQAERLHLHMGMNIEDSVADVSYSLATTRTHFRKRLALLAPNKAELLDKLASFARTGETPAGATRSPSDQTANSNLALLFTGQGSQLPGMGQNLYSVYPVFREALDEIAGHFFDLEKPLLEVMWATANSEEAALLNRTDFTQPALFSLEVALWRLWESWGIEPKLLLGHSIGELAAAHVAGVFDLSDACRLVSARGRLMQALPSGGAMASLEANGTEVEKAIASLSLNSTLSIAGLNTPQQTVVSGKTESVGKIVEHFAQSQRKTKHLKVSHAFHSHLMDGMLAPFQSVADTIRFALPNIPLVSSLTGDLADPEEITTPDYWVRQAREAVKFNAGMQTLYQHGTNTFLELGPHPVLSGMGAICLSDASSITWLPSLSSDKEDAAVMQRSLTKLHVLGNALNWRGYFAPFGGHRVRLPGYAFQRERFWLEPPPSREIGAGLINANHLLLGGGTQIAGTDTMIFTTVITSEEPVWVKEHQVMDAILLPGTAFLEAMRAAGKAMNKGAWDISEVIILSPMVITPGSAIRMQITVGAEAAGSRSVQVYSAPETKGDDGTWQLHAEGKLVAAQGTAQGSAQSTQALAVTLPPQGAQPLDTSALYSDLAELGYGYGPTFQGIKEAWHVGDVVWTKVALPDLAESSASRYGLHPALLDSAMHSLLLTQQLKNQTSDDVYVPFEAEKLSIWQDSLSELWVKVSDFELGEGEFWASLDLYNSQGLNVGRLHRLHARRIERSALRRLAVASVDRYQFDLAWHSAEIENLEVSGTWGLLCCQPIPWAEKVRVRLAEADVDFVDLLHFSEADGLDGVICLWDAEADVIANAHELSALALSQIQELAAAQFPQPMVWVTRGAVGTGSHDRVSRLGSASLWGLMRTARNEHPELTLRLLDIGETSDDLSTLGTALMLETEPECALRNKQVLVPRLERATAGRDLVIPSEGKWQMEIAAKGRLDEPLTVKSIADKALAAGEVRAIVKATGVNFLDVLNALGMIEIPAFGLEFAGVITEVGSGVKDLSVGDPILGLARGSFASEVVTDARQAVRMPDSLSFEEAATIPMTFLTAWYGLHVLGSIQPGERVLIHSAAGGVGMAAVQIAQLQGAEVYGTASQPKWPALRQWGLDDDHIASSRDLTFVEHFGKTAPGRSFDIVLNSLAKEFIDTSLSMLVEGGRFLEMGKIDLREQAWIDQHHPGVTYRVYNLPEAGPECIQEMLLSLATLFAEGKLKPLPHRTFPIDKTSDALRFMAQARHIGKVVLVPAQQRHFVQSDGAVLITGGVGGLGRYIAKWLVTKHEVKDFVLTSRRGLASPGAEAFVAELSELGAEATVVACDAAEAKQLETVMSTFDQARPLRGIVHAAGVLDDGVLSALTPERLETVFAPKLDGAWNLHQLSQDMALDFFIMFSSLSGVMGTPGQGNYAAANAFLDALAHHRQARGLCASSIAWGAWDGQGMAALLSEADRTRFSRQGMDALTPEEGAELLEAAVMGSRPLTVAAALDLTRLQRTFEEGGAGVPALFRSLFGNAASARSQSSSSSGENLRQILSETAPEAQESVVLQMVREEVARTLEFSSPEDVDINLSLQDIGIDSLTAVLMRNQLADMTGLALPAKIAFDHPNLRALGQYILEKIRESGLEVTAKPTQQPAKLAVTIDNTGARKGYLHPDLHFKNTATIASRPETVFVTGATGFVGTFVLHELLKSNITTYCLVRANNDNHAKERLEETLKGYGLWQANYTALIKPVIGDLAQPYFGLSENNFNRLADTVDAICHSGAVVDWMLPLDIYLGPNVVGTHEVLRLASQGKGKAVHYISTYATLPKYLGYEVTEETLDYGYLTSKWMGEQMVAAARWRGAVASVYRLPFVGACSSSGYFRLDRGDFLHNLIAGCISMGSFPSINGNLNGLLPVDYLAQVIVQTMQGEQQQMEKNYDFLNPKAPSFNSFVDLIRTTGCQVETLPYEEWQVKVLQSTKEQPDSLLARISVLLKNLTQQELELMLEGYPVGDDVCGGTHHPCPPVDKASVQPYVERISADLAASHTAPEQAQQLAQMPV